MEIREENIYTTIKDIRNGYCFMYDEHVYSKTDSRSPEAGECQYCILVENGELKSLPLGTKVTALKSILTVSL